VLGSAGGGPVVEEEEGWMVGCAGCDLGCVLEVKEEERGMILVAVERVAVDAGLVACGGG